MAVLQVSELRFEHHPTGLGVHVASPHVSWKLTPTTERIPRKWTQTSYEIEVKRPGGSKSFPGMGNNTILVPWPDEPLASGESANVRVKSFGASCSTEWSAWARVEAGLLTRGDWTAKCITAPPRTDQKHANENGIRPVRFRKAFELSATLQRARVYITALGLYEAYLNGKRIGNECLAPGWTSYQARIQYQVFDIANLLVAGKLNVFSIEVGEGWYAGRLLWGDGISCFYGDKLGVLAQLDVFDSEESLQPNFRLTTDRSWECSQSAIVASGIYDGETYDLGLETDWVNSINSGSWQNVDILDFPDVQLVASSCPPVRVTEEVKPIKVFKDPDGKTLADFGQNLVGKIRIPTLSRPDGTRLRIGYAEVLDHERLGTRPLRRAKATDTIIFDGSGKRLKDWAAHFTFHGFRYVEITGWSPDDASEPITEDSLTALVIHTDMRRTGFFECSNLDICQLYENICWSMRGNFVSIPLDCPQRDERLGWTGDIQVFSPTASFIFNSVGMLGNWLRDVLAEQKEDGGIVPLVAPNAMKYGPWPCLPQAVWDDVIIIVPWNLYRFFGDTQVLRETYPGMQDYLGTIKRGPDGLWTDKIWQLGDWLDPNSPPQEPGLARTDGVLVADAFLVHVTKLMSKIATVLGLAEDAAKYAAEAANLKHRFQDKYITKAGLVVADSQTALALVLLFELHDEPAQKKVATDRLGRLVRYSKFRVSTGFAGTPNILHALSESGNTHLAYAMLLEKECPSWLYPVSMGATTIWERWDSMLPDGTINPGQMTSFNHYALGSVADWLHANVGGISPVEGGWKKFLVRPRPGGEITSAKIKFLSGNGEIKCQWAIEKDSFDLSLTVPPNTSAVVAIPDGSERTVGSGEYNFTCKMPPSEPWPPKPLLTQFQDYDPSD